MRQHAGQLGDGEDEDEVEEEFERRDPGGSVRRLARGGHGGVFHEVRHSRRRPLRQNEGMAEPAREPPAPTSSAWLRGRRPGSCRSRRCARGRSSRSQSGGYRTRSTRVGRSADPRAGGAASRAYLPPARRAAAGARVWFHGGGWVIGDLDTHDGICRALANGAGCVVVSVDYRLAPEHPFPAAVDDCLRRDAWVGGARRRARRRPGRVAVGGDSAGGNLAAVVALLARDAGGPASRFQLLVYPVTDLDASTRRRIARTATGYLLTTGGDALVLGPLPRRRRRPQDPRRVAAARRRPARPAAGARASPPSSTRCATRARPTPSGCARPACRSRSRATTA